MRKFNLVIVASILIIAPFLASADTLYRQLQVGSTGADVSSLQSFLASDPAIYPQGTVSGYFGFLTKAAVSNFQSRNGLPAVGRVGPATLPVINAQMAGNVGNTTKAPIISSARVDANRNSATVIWATNEDARGVVYYSTSPLTTYEGENSVSVSGTSAMTDTNFHSSQSVAISGLQANTTYYYLVHTTDQTGNVSVTWPATFRTTN